MIERVLPMAIYSVDENGEQFKDWQYVGGEGVSVYQLKSQPNEYLTIVWPKT